MFQSWCGKCGCSQDLSYCRVRLDWAGQVCLVWVCEEFPTLYTVQLNLVHHAMHNSYFRDGVCMYIIFLLASNGRMSLGGTWGSFFFFLLEFCDVTLLPLPNWSHRYVIECKHCGVIFRSRQHWYGNPEPEQKAIKTENKHVWPEVRRVYCVSSCQLRCVLVMLVCCKFHMLSGIASIAGILSFEARTNANYTMCLLLQVLYSRESECIIQNFYFYNYQQM